MSYSQLSGATKALHIASNLPTPQIKPKTLVVRPFNRLHYLFYPCAYQNAFSCLHHVCHGRYMSNVCMYMISVPGVRQKCNSMSDNYLYNAPGVTPHRPRCFYVKQVQLHNGKCQTETRRAAGTQEGGTDKDRLVCVVKNKPAYKKSDYDNTTVAGPILGEQFFFSWEPVREISLIKQTRQGRRLLPEVLGEGEEGARALKSLIFYQKHIQIVVIICQLGLKT